MAVARRRILVGRMATRVTLALKKAENRAFVVMKVRQGKNIVPESLCKRCSKRERNSRQREAVCSRQCRAAAGSTEVRKVAWRSRICGMKKAETNEIPIQGRAQRRQLDIAGTARGVLAPKTVVFRQHVPLS